MEKIDFKDYVALILALIKTVSGRKIVLIIILIVVVLLLSFVGPAGAIILLHLH